MLWRWLLVLPVLVDLSCRGTPYREVEIDFSGSPQREAAAPSGARGGELRFSVAAMQSPQATHHAYARLIERIGRLLGVRVKLVQRRTYREVNDLLVAGHVDVAFVCTGGYFDLVERPNASVSLLVVPVVRRKTTYQSLIIVPATSSARGVADLAGTHFAFTDELSFTGNAYPNHLLKSLGHFPAKFFGSTLFTHSHDRSTHAIARRLVDGAAVDSLVYDALVERDPMVARETRILHRSPPYGIPPIVAGDIPDDVRDKIRAVFLRLHEDAHAAQFLRELHTDRFVVPGADLYDSARIVFKDTRP